MKKLHIVLIVIAVLLVLILGYITSLNYFNVKFDEEWLDCETDDDCIFVKPYSYCSCYDIAINKNFEDDYNSFLTKSRIYQKISFMKIQVICAPCEKIENPVPKCDDTYGKNICIVGSSS